MSMYTLYLPMNKPITNHAYSKTNTRWRRSGR